jgi:opacity protein-like surface antigen
MRPGVVLAAICLFSSVGFSQVFEASGSFGRCLFGGSRDIGALSNDAGAARYRYKDGFHMALRMTINSYRFIGYEFGYAYNRTSLETIVENEPVSFGVPIHHGFGNVLLYALPEGTRVRPFVTGGGHFSSFFPPGASASYGNQTTKFGFNYGAGVKVWTTTNWGFRVDGRFYEGGKPFNLPDQRGRLRQLELSAGISFFM